MFDNPSDAWKPISYEQAGWSRELAEGALSYAESIGINRFFVANRGRVIMSSGDISEPTDIRSCRKPFYAALFGVFVQKGLITLDTTLGELGITDGANGNQPTLSVQEQSATMYDVLTSTSGVYHPAAFETPSMKSGRPARDSRLPGTYYWYNNWDFNTLPAILSELSGQGIEGTFDLLNEYLFQPLGFQDYEESRQRYSYSSEKSIYPAPRLALSSRDCARFLTLLCNDGVWDGKYLLSPGWVTQMRKPVVNTIAGARGMFCDVRVEVDGSVHSSDPCTTGIRHGGKNAQAITAYTGLGMSVSTLRSTDVRTPTWRERNNLMQRLRDAAGGNAMFTEPPAGGDDESGG